MHRIKTAPIFTSRYANKLQRLGQVIKNALLNFENLTFGEQLREIDQKAKAAEVVEQQQQNIQYAMIALWHHHLRHSIFVAEPQYYHQY